MHWLLSYVLADDYLREMQLLPATHFDGSKWVSFRVGFYSPPLLNKLLQINGKVGFGSNRIPALRSRYLHLLGSFWRAGYLHGCLPHRAALYGRDMGRHSKYDPAIIPQVAKLCDLGATNDQIADFFGIDADTLERWTVRHEELAEVMRIGKAPADNRVERRLYERAVGYDYFEEVVAKSPEGPVVLTVKKHQPPDIAAMKIWLLNRKRHQWSDRKEIAIEGNVRVQHKTIDPAMLTDEQREVLRLAIQQALLPAPEDADYTEM